MRTMAMNIHGYSMQKVNKKSWKIFSEKRENTLVKVIVVLLYFLKKDHGEKRL